MSSRFFVYLAVMSVFYSLCSAQPSWLKNVEQMSRELEVDDRSAAIVLHNITDIEISSRGNAIITRQVAYKILSSDGLHFGIFSQSISPFMKVKNHQIFALHVVTLKLTSTNNARTIKFFLVLFSSFLFLYYHFLE